MCVEKNAGTFQLRFKEICFNCKVFNNQQLILLELVINTIIFIYIHGCKSRPIFKLTRPNGFDSLIYTTEKSPIRLIFIFKSKLNIIKWHSYMTFINALWYYIVNYIVSKMISIKKCILPDNTYGNLVSMVNRNKHIFAFFWARF